MRSKLRLGGAGAVIAHNPKLVPLSADVKYSENDRRIDIGDGLWKTAQGRGKYTHIFSDPEFGEVAYMGTMMEAGAPFLLSLRLRTELGHITEIESVLFKPGGGGPNNIANIVWRSSSWVTTSSFRISTTDATRWWTRNAA